MVTFMHDTITSARYLIRFDDICPTMNWEVWEDIEGVLDQYAVKPLLAVVPDNQDEKLMVDKPREDFWERVRGWQAKGYAIGLHGHQHKYVNKNPGLMKLTPQSEFAGRPRLEQSEKLAAALAIFGGHGVTADAWVAPAHSFDSTTVQLLSQFGIGVISDGLSRMPFVDRRSIVWIPQQLWSFRPKKSGIWTVCQHHNRWTPAQRDKFRANVRSYSRQMTNMQTIVRDYCGRKQALTDKLISAGDLTWNHRVRPALSSARRWANILQGNGRA